ncbi:hypothetical protein QO002_000016 [Pararhizobium capsulatum DSM 1112]|uniref:Uncharacterized protein n=1 Tax=Pararhizobium capsulatum DSM 1112 TaxID=1121113 RepID=A0ABU0BI02_9HYPH|nr:DUF6030 family protein [Pararhizobium capsulatum]MDQ0317878.1 hypothetical protein [Pararhizobium capsulatum DSM 1112]
MAQGKRERSGKLFFLVALLVIFVGILTTALLANDGRSLRLLLRYFEIEMPAAITLSGSSSPEQEQSVPFRSIKGTRLPPAHMVLPTFAFADMKSPPQTFLRAIRSDPRSLCEQVKEAGFRGMDWVISSSNRDNWECSSLTTVLPSTDGDGAAESSIFVSIKGDGENRVTSFRVKLNIERPADSGPVAALAADAAMIFLDRAQWENSEEVVRLVRSLKEFELDNFGSRIRFKKEMGEVPRYNFIASQAPGKPRRSPVAAYFDRERWLPLSDDDKAPMVGGMRAGEGAGGLPLAGVKSEEN